MPTFFEILGPSNWGFTGPSMNAFYTFAIHRGRLYAGGRVVSGSPSPTARLLVSDNGRNWSQVSVPFVSSDNEIRRLWSASNGYLYIGVQSGTPRLYRTLDGVTFTDISATSTLTATDAYPRWFAEFKEFLYLAVVTDNGVQARVIRTPLWDGVNWTQCFLSPDTTVDSLNSLYADENFIYVTSRKAAPGQTGGVFRSSNGTSWARINSAQFNTGTDILHSMIKWKGLLWVGTQNTAVGGSIWSSGDNGATWTKRSADGIDALGAANEEFYRLFAYNDNVMIMGCRNRTSGGTLYYTTDGDTYTRFGAEQGDTARQGIFDFIFYKDEIVTSSRSITTSTDFPIRYTRIIHPNLGVDKIMEKNIVAAFYDPITQTYVIKDSRGQDRETANIGWASYTPQQAYDTFNM